jgi:putative hydrolase of the HAD superfamily
MYDAVLLDLYDTFAWSAWRVWQQTLADRLGVTYEEVGRAFDATRPIRSIGTYADATEDLAVVVRETGVRVSPEELATLRDLEREQIEESLNLYDDSLPVLRALRARGVKTALVSNCSHNTKPGVERLGLYDEFDAVILSYELGVRKPDPAIYRAALEALGGPAPERSVFVDDQPPYCDGAASLGLDAMVIFRPNQPSEGTPASSNGHRAITDLTTLIPI